MFWIMTPIYKIAPSKGLQGDAAQSAASQTRNTGANPFTGPTALHPIRRTKQLWLSVLLKDTSAATGNRTHILDFWQHQNF